ncbi:hypothetical protein GYMLUDRAFT_246503 [Collybiopsis luxurians FD-317 M1]|uniref:Uncharacterized protein n=1 Tax=Collybiopsis luxurians FD-317 M1 TaxID=944289 RepID=A0A0D0BS58_9AGAR|nr:hypothetical protein GYMLUDRAFT_246503 [Collybiopsis luxurians FD-317 M1]
MFIFTCISKVVPSVLGITLLFSQPVLAVGPNGTQSDIPTFTQVYDFAFLADPQSDIIPGPFGNRILRGWLGGNLTNTTTGELVGQIVPGIGGELGVVSDLNSKLYSDIGLAFQWADDQKFAFLRMHGIGSSTGNDTATAAVTLYAEMETESPSRQNLVNSFLLATVSLEPPSSSSPNATIGSLKLFAQSSPDGVITG